MQVDIEITWNYNHYNVMQYSYNNKTINHFFFIKLQESNKTRIYSFQIKDRKLNLEEKKQ